MPAYRRDGRFERVVTPARAVRRSDRSRSCTRCAGSRCTSRTAHTRRILPTGTAPCAGANGHARARLETHLARRRPPPRLGDQMVEHRPTDPCAAAGAAVCIDFTSAWSVVSGGALRSPSRSPPTPRTLWNVTVGSTSGVDIDGVDVARRCHRVGELVVRGAQLDRRRVPADRPRPITNAGSRRPNRAR